MENINKQIKETDSVNSEFLYLIPIKIEVYYVSMDKWKEAIGHYHWN